MDKEQKGYRFVKCTVDTQPEGAGAWRKARIPWRVLRQLAHAYQEIEGIGDDAFWEDVYRKLAELMPEWTLVDSEGNPLDNPSSNPLIFDDLDDAELRWIFTEVMGGRAAPST